MNVFLKNKNYRKFSVASFLSDAGDVLFYLAFMTYASKLQNYTLALSLIAISESIPRLFDIFGGYLADKTQQKFKKIFLMAVIRFILYGIVGLLFIGKMSQWNLVIIVVVINFFSDVAGAYSDGLVAPLIVDLVGEKDFGEAEGFTSGISQIVTLIFQFVGSGLLLLLSYSNLAFFNAFTFLIAGLLYLSVGLKYKTYKKHSEEHSEVNDQNFWSTMKSSYIQVKKEKGLLSIVLVIALLNGALGAMGSLLPITIAANRSTMVISTYSFTIAVIGVTVSSGAILGSMFSQQLFKKASVFSITIAAIILSILTAFAALIANIFTILPIYFLLSASASIASIKMQQWLVTSIEHKILASTVGLLRTIVMAAAPIMTTLLTTISGLSNIKYALFTLIAVELIVLIISIKMTFNVKVIQTPTKANTVINK